LAADEKEGTQTPLDSCPMFIEIMIRIEAFWARTSCSRTLLTVNLSIVKTDYCVGC
jgi:hypothetical protein